MTGATLTMAYTEYSLRAAPSRQHASVLASVSTTDTGTNMLDYYLLLLTKLSQ